jgi:hypothetical protein
MVSSFLESIAYTKFEKFNRYEDYLYIANCLNEIKLPVPTSFVLVILTP